MGLIEQPELSCNVRLKVDTSQTEGESLFSDGISLGPKYGLHSMGKHFLVVCIHTIHTCEC